MARLTRMQKYSDYREKMANDSEASLVSEGLSKYQDELKKVRELASNETEEIIQNDPIVEITPEVKVADVPENVIDDLLSDVGGTNEPDDVLKALEDFLSGSISSSIFDENIVTDVVFEEGEEPAKETAEVLTENIFEPLIEEISEEVSEEEAVIEEIDDSFVEEEVAEIEEEEIPDAVIGIGLERAEVIGEVEEPEDTVEIVSINELFKGLGQSVANKTVEESYQNDINSLIEDLLKDNTFEIPDFKDSVFTNDINEIDVEAEEEEAAEIEETLTTTVEDEIAEIIDSLTDSAEEEAVPELKRVPLILPTVRKSDKTDEVVYEQIENCVTDVASIVDYERIINGVPAPKMWVEPVKVKVEEPETVEVVPEPEDNSVVELIDLFSDLEKEYTNISANDSLDDLIIPFSDDEEEEDDLSLPELALDDIVTDEFTKEILLSDIAESVKDSAVEEIVESIPVAEVKLFETAEEVVAEEATAEVDETVAEEAVVEETVEEVIETVEETGEAEVEEVEEAEEVIETPEVEEVIESSENEEVVEAEDDIFEADDEELKRNLAKMSDDVMDDLVMTNKFNTSLISSALKEADDFKKKEGLVSVEDISRRIIHEVDASKAEAEDKKPEESLEHPVAVLKEGETEEIEIRNFAELAEEEREAVLDDTIPFVIEKKAKKSGNKKEETEVFDDEDDAIPNKILNIVLAVLIVILLLVLSVVIYYILLAQGVIR